MVYTLFMSIHIDYMHRTGKSKVLDTPVAFTAF